VDVALVECYGKGTKLKVRITSDGYDSSLNMSFPKSVREDGARYSVPAQAISLKADGKSYIFSTAFSHRIVRIEEDDEDASPAQQEHEDEDEDEAPQKPTSKSNPESKAKGKVKTKAPVVDAESEDEDEDEDKKTTPARKESKGKAKGKSKGKGKGKGKVTLDEAVAEQGHKDDGPRMKRRKTT
jgi:hypothetical protein